MKGLNRRLIWALLFCGTICATGAAIGHETPPSSPRSVGLAPLDEEAWDLAKARHLLWRAGFGGTAADVRQLYELGLPGAVDHLLNYELLSDIEVEMPPLPQLEVVGPELRALPQEKRREIVDRFQRQSREYLNELRRSWLTRMVGSPRPLQEKLALFWHGHFATDYRTVDSSMSVMRQNELFRTNASGNFGDLLHAIVRDPAMLRYLDNNRNVRGRPNENLARELMELFSMGEGSGYGERDIAEGARALTGYTFQRETSEFAFASRQHDPGDKTIFGQTGTWNGDQFVDLILQQPATAAFISRKLFEFFVHDHPDAELIAELADRFRQDDYEIKPLLRTLFLSEEFYSERSIGQHIKSPAELVIGTVRGLHLDHVESGLMFQSMRAMGQELFNPPNVRGWEGGPAWINSNTMFARNNFVAVVLLGNTPAGPNSDRRMNDRAGSDRRAAASGPVDWTERVLAEGCATVDDVVGHFADTLLAVPLSEAKRRELCAVLEELPGLDEWPQQRRVVNRRIAAMLVLMLTQPEYQLN